MSKITQLLYEITDEDFRLKDREFYSWDKVDCSDVGALVVTLKYLLERDLNTPYYLDSYPKHEKLYKVLFEGEDSFIS